MKLRRPLWGYPLTLWPYLALLLVPYVLAGLAWLI